MAEKLPKSKIAELGNKLKKGAYWSRFVKMEDGTEGTRWVKEEKDIDLLETWHKDGTELEYTFQADPKGGDGRIRLFLPKAEGEENKDTGKRKSEYTKEKEEKDKYWKNKEEFEQRRVTINDRKIELQHYQKLVEPIIRVAVEREELTWQEGLEAIDEWGLVLYNRHNPDTPATVKK